MSQERSQQRTSFLTALVVSVLVVYGPFVAAPFLADLGTDPESRRQWFQSLVFLPGLLAANLFDHEGAAFLLVAIGASLAWVLLCAVLSRRTWVFALLSLLIAIGLAALTVPSFRR